MWPTKEKMAEQLNVPTPSRRIQAYRGTHVTLATNSSRVFAPLHQSRAGFIILGISLYWEDIVYVVRLIGVIDQCRC